VSNSLVGQTLGHYKILDQLGAGGMGVVYRAQDTKLGRQVALKVLPTSSNSASDEAVERFRREARTASSLNHQNICTIYSFDEHEGQLYLAMELLDGEPLDRRLSGRPLDLRQMLDISAQVADALDAAHAEGILHRDVKPANIFLTRRGPVKVLDFGLAKLSPEYRRRSDRLDAKHETRIAEHFTSAVGTTVGTIAYMSPEQARGDDVDPRTDLFSFGVVLYEMATGRQSFPGHTTAVVFDGILNRDPVPPSTLNAALPPELDRIISKALEKDRSLRYQTAADIGADLKRLRRDSGSKSGMPAISGVIATADAATVVINSSPTVIGAPSGIGSAPTITSAPIPQRPSDPSAVIRAAAKTPWFWGAGAAVLTIAAVAAGVGAYLANRGGAPPQQTQTITPAPAQAAAPAPAVVDPTPVNASGTDTPPAGAPGTAVPPPTVAAAPTQPPVKTAPLGPAGATQKPAAGTAPAVATTKPATKAGPTAALPTPVSRDSEAAQRLEVAKAKLANNLNDQALADLRQIIVEYPNTAPAAEAAFLAADVHEKTGRMDDAMAAFVEFEQRFGRDRRAVESKLRRAQILSRRPNPQAQQQARDLWGEVARDHAGTPHAQIALQQKLRMETERKNLRELDPVMNIQVPAVIPTLRLIIQQFPDSPQAMAARNRLALMLEDLDRWAETAQVLEDLGARAGGNPAEVWFRLGEIYERRLKDPVRAKEAYAKVPQGSPRYNEAQRRLKRSE
jgi:serine/threonine protein kinase/TolA-binding protein